MTMNQITESFGIYHDLIINAPLTKIFESIGDPNHLINWWPNRCTGKPGIGETYNFCFTPDYDWYGKVIECIPDKSFHIKMTDSDPDWNPTTFGFDLKEVNNKVQLKFWHVGWPDCNEHFKRSSFCWAMLLNRLRNYVEKGS